MNETYDFFEIKDKWKGLEKGYTTIEWDFLVNDTQEAVAVRFVDDQVFSDYKTPLWNGAKKL
jgi:hypothetical protein